MTREERQEYNRQYRIDHRNEIKRWKKQYCIDHCNEIRNFDRQYYKDHIKKINWRNKQYYNDHLKEARQRSKQYRKDYIKEVKAYQIQYSKDHLEEKKKYNNQRRKTNIQFRLACNLRNRLRYALKGKFKCGSAVRNLGCSLDDLKKHLESQFQPGMTWDNRGKNGWHLDHIIPLSKFNLQDRQQFLIANNYTNLQPLWAKDNWSKRDFSVLDYRGGIF
jgi:hypothetical protein